MATFMPGFTSFGEGRSAVGVREGVAQRAGRRCERLGVPELGDDRVLRHLDGDALGAVVDL